MEHLTARPLEKYAVGALLTNLVTPYIRPGGSTNVSLTTATEGEARRSIYTNALMVILHSIVFLGVGTALWYFLPAISRGI